MSVHHDIWYSWVSIIKFSADVASKVRDKCHWPAGWRLAATSPLRDLTVRVQMRFLHTHCVQYWNFPHKMTRLWALVVGEIIIWILDMYVTSLGSLISTDNVSQSIGATTGIVGIGLECWQTHISITGGYDKCVSSLCQTQIGNEATAEGVLVILFLRSQFSVKSVHTWLGRFYHRRRCFDSVLLNWGLGSWILDTPHHI